MSNSLLAIDGADPTVNLGSIPWPCANDEIQANIKQAIADGSWGQYEGRWTTELVGKLKAEFQTEFSSLCSSGTIAVELALRGCGVSAEDEVILAGYDFPGNFRAIEAIGALPVLIDVVENGWVIDADQISQAIGEHTAAIIVSHLHGQIASMEQVRSIIDQHNSNREKKISIVEDVCQTPGGSLNQKPLGSLGDVAALSFGGSKLLSAGRGGAILTDNADILQRIKIFSQRGNDAFPLSQLQAAVLLPQLDTLKKLTEQRNQNAMSLITMTDSLDGLSSLSQATQNVVPSFYKLPWLLKDRTPGWSRADFVHALSAEGLAIGEGFRGFLRRSPRRCRKVGTLVNSQIAAQQTVLLSHPILMQPESAMELVGQAIEKVVANPR